MYSHNLAVSQPAERTPAFDEALRVSLRGWSVIPCKADKTPDAELLRAATGKTGWRQFQDRCPSGGEVGAWTDAECFGVVTGTLSGVVVLDVDPGGDKSLRGLHLPDTMVAETPRGRHYYFRCPPGSLRSSAGILPGVDVRGDGGYAILPGPDGREWAFGMGDFESLADCPEWLLQLARKGPGPQPKQASVPTPKPRPLPVQEPADAPILAGSLDKNLGRWFTHPEVATRCARVMGADVERVGQNFLDILPSSKPDTVPSANLYQRPSGVIVYRSFRIDDGNLSLDEVRASIAYGRLTRLSKRDATGRFLGFRPEQAVWSIRLLIEAGLVKPAKVPHKPLTDDAPPSARKVYQGFLDLLGAKWLHTYGEPTMYARKFTMAWCGITEKQARTGIQWLVRNEYITKVGEHRRSWVFMPSEGEGP